MTCLIIEYIGQGWVASPVQWSAGFIQSRWFLYWCHPHGGYRNISPKMLCRYYTHIYTVSNCLLPYCPVGGNMAGGNLQGNPNGKPIV